MEELFERTEKVLQACLDKNNTLSHKKLYIGTFAGFIFSCLGKHPTEERLRAIREFPVPTNVTKLRGFLGTANQLFHFIPDGAQIAEPLRQLTQIKSAFVWGPDQEAAFQSYKNALHHELILYHFNPKFKTVMITDASRIGLGFILFQVAQGAGPPGVIQCGSRSVSGAESCTQSVNSRD